jgi:hypothetical protein
LRQVRLGAVCWLPCFAVGAGLAMNRVFDAGPPATHDATYLGYHSAHKGPAHVRLSSWREPRGEERMTCTAGRSEALCPSLTPGAAVAVTVRQGALGWEWVERVSPR